MSTRMSMDELRRLVPGHAALAESEENLLAWAERESEAALQRKCEVYLHWRGYYKRTTHHIEASPVPPMGWQIHLVKAPKNPILLDLLLLHEATGLSIEIELKTVRGVTSHHQALLLNLNPHRHLVRSPAELKTVLDTWEEEVRAHQQLAHDHMALQATLDHMCQKRDHGCLDATCPTCDTPGGTDA